MSARPRVTGVREQLKRISNAFAEQYPGRDVEPALEQWAQSLNLLRGMRL